MGFSFQKVLRVLPGVRINLSKSGASASLGPRGADINIGRHGVTTNAGIPGTGLSYRSKVGGHGATLGILALVAGLGYAVYKNSDRIGALVSQPPTTITSAAHTLTASKSELASDAVTQAAEPATGTRYVHRAGSVLRDAPRSAAHALKRESKGARVILIARSGPWAKVRDGNIIGWMRSSVLGTAPPE